MRLFCVLSSLKCFQFNKAVRSANASVHIGRLTLLLGYLQNITMRDGKSDVLCIKAGVFVCDIQMACVLYLHNTLPHTQPFQDLSHAELSTSQINQRTTESATVYLLSLGEGIMLAF